MVFKPRSAWTSTSNRAVAIKRKQVHVTWHHPGFGNSSVRTADWSLERCYRQLRAWRNQHVGSGAYREAAYNYYALPTGDFTEGRGNRQNGANGKSSANRAGQSIQVLKGDDEPLTAGHARAMFDALAHVEKLHPGIVARQYGHDHWVGTACPGPHVRAEIPLSLTAPAPGTSKPAPAPAPASKAPPFPLPRRRGRLFYYGPPSGPITSVSGRGLNTAVPADVQRVNGRWRSKGLMDWQAQARRRGYGITVDGRYGSETERITRYFQGLVGLKVDGKIGPATWAACWEEPVR